MKRLWIIALLFWLTAWLVVIGAMCLAQEAPKERGLPAGYFLSCQMIQGGKMHCAWTRISIDPESVPVTALIEQRSIILYGCMAVRCDDHSKQRSDEVLEEIEAFERSLEHDARCSNITITWTVRP